MKRGGFIMAYTIIIVFLSMLMFAGLYSLFASDIQIVNYQKENLINFFSYSNNNYTISKAYKSMNSDGSNLDNLSCSGGVIACYEGQEAACSSNNWVALPDGISDDCDNDDGNSSYYSGNVSNLLASDSKEEDNDAYVVKNSVGFLVPGETKTVFYFNEEMKSYFLINSSNYSSTLNKTYDKIQLNGNFSFTGSTVDLYILKKGDPDSKVILKKHGAIITNTGIYDDSGNFDNKFSPYLNDGDTYDIVLNLTNTSTGVLEYKVYASYYSRQIP